MRSSLHRYGLVFTAAFILAGPAAGDDSEKMPLDPRERAAYFVRTGQIDKALSLYRVLAAQNPRNTERMKELMWALWHADRYAETADVALRMNALTPNDTEILNLLARARAMMGQKQAAIAIYEKSLALNTDQLSVRLAIVRLQIDLKNLDTASATLSRLKADYPREPAIYANQAQIAFVKGSFEDALSLWNQAISLSPDNFLYKVHQIEVLYHLGQMPKAHEKLTTLVAKELRPWPAKNLRDLWALLETVPAAPGEKTAPLEPYSHPLGLDEVQIGLAIGRLYSDLRDYEAASRILSDLESKHKDNPEIYSRLARQYFLRGLYPDASKAWSNAVRLSPDEVTYQYEEARSLYYAGERRTARKKLQEVTTRQSNYKWRAIDFLTDIALINSDLRNAQDYLESNIADLHRPDEPRLMRLARIYAERGEITKCLSTLDGFIAQNPKDGRALMFKADMLLQHGRTIQAIELYKKVIQLNPKAVRAHFSLADAYNLRHNPREALSHIEKARAIDPTDPYLLIWEARYLYDAGEIRKSTHLLETFLKTTPRPAVPAILYHGLTTLEHDPLLAYSVHLSSAAFEDHMGALSAAGYQPITAQEMNDWMLGTQDLPVKKPVLIAFDDARLDAIRNADPILDKYHLKATMFVPLVNVDKNLPGYTSWDQLKTYQDTGRWEMQLHGDLAHTRIPVDAEGRSGLYLINQQWLASEQRLETTKEWVERVAADHASGKRKMIARLGRTPVAFAYPEGDFGQLGLPSSTKASEINLAEAAKAYGTSYHQDPFGINIRSRDPQLLTRVEPRQGTTGVDLIHMFAEKNPFTMARITLLRQATWQGSIHSALDRLAELRKEPDLSPQVLLTQEAQIHYAARDLAYAERLVDQASTFGNTTDLQTLHGAIETEKRYTWTPSFVYQEDNRRRKDWFMHQTLSTWGFGRTRWILHHMRGLYQEPGTANVTQNAVGLGSAIRLGLFHTLDLRFLGQFLSGERDLNTYTASGGLRSQWTDQWATAIEGGRNLFGSALAMKDGVAERYARGSVTWAQENRWEMKSRGKFSDLTDGNHFYDVEFDVTRQLIADTNFRVGYHFEAEHMQQVRPAYYSPQNLMVHHAVVQLSMHVPPGFFFQARYLPGYGKEDGAKGDFVNDLELSFPIPLGKKTMLTPEIWFNRTPTYRRDSYGVSLTHRF